MEDEIFSETGTWLARRKLFNKLSMDTNLLSIDTTIRKFYDSTGTTAIGRIQNYEQRLKLLSDTAVFADYKTFNGHLYNAENLLAGVEYTNTAEENYVRVNQIYLNKLDSPATAFSPAQLTTLRNLAVKCPYIAGDAVYIARSLLAREEDSIFYYDLHLCTIDSGSAKKDVETFIPATKTDSILIQIDTALTEMVKVFPNPANSQLNLKYKAIVNGNAEFQLFNVYGQLVKTDQIAHNVYSTTFNIINIPVGIYYWKLKDSSRTIATGRVNIVR